MSDSSLNESEPKFGSNEKAPYVSGGITNDLDHLAKLEHFNDGSLTTEDVEIIAAHLDDRPIEECRKIIETAVQEHEGDVALMNSYYNHLCDLVKGPMGEQSDDEWETIVKFEAFLIHDWSIYPSVRSVTRPIDEEEYQNYENIRVYLNSILWSCAGSVLATFFAVRFPSISMNSVALQILIAYTGKGMSYIPGFSFPIGFGRRCHFGSGKWNFKEQMLATCGMGVGNAAPYSQYVVLAMANDYFYGFKDAQGNFGFTVLLTLATNLMGFGLAGLFRIFLVYPTRMIWFGSLPGIRLSRVLVQGDTERENIDGWRLKGWEFFWIFVVVFFGWFWITDFLFAFLSTFDWIAWIAHTNNNMLAICGVQSGLGLNPISTFDPSLITPSAMIQPLFSTVCMLLGMFFSFFIIVGLWYMNISWTSYLPINSNGIFDNAGNTYNVTAVLDENNNLDIEKYKNYSMPFWTAANLTVYGSFFAFYPAMIVFAILNYTKILMFSFRIFSKTIINPRKALNSFNDRFTRAQRKYKEVPEWWYLFFLVVCLALGIAFVEHYKFSNTPVWTIFFGVGLSAVFMIPSGVLYATTNMQVLINVLYELVIGLTVEGNGSALMVSKAFATNFMVGTDNFISNLKQSHYVGLAPRAMFRIQIINCICNSFVQSGIIVWQSRPGSIKNMCNPDLTSNPSRFICADIRTYFSAAVEWGTIGPRRVMRDLYPRLRWTFLAGALFPVPFWILRTFLSPMARERRWGAPVPNGSRLRNSSVVLWLLNCDWCNSFNELLIISGCLNWAPYNFMYYLPWLYVGLAFQWYLPRYHLRWWSKYNYLLYAAISVGYTYADLIMFFATEYKHAASISWWGNDDAVSLSASPRLPVPDSGTFGPTTWENN